MNIVIRWQGAEYEVNVDIGDDTLPVGRLLGSLLGSQPAVIAVDGRHIDPSTPVAEVGLGNGSLIEAAADGDPRHVGALLDVTGSVSFQVQPLQVGTLTVGAAPSDVTVETTGRVVLRIDPDGGVHVRNLDSADAFVDGDPVDGSEARIRPGSRMAVGNRVFEIAPEVEAQRRHGVFNRPPRQPMNHRPAQLQPPRQPQQPAKPMRFGWGALIVPIILGVGMAILVHPRMAVFAVFSPAMLLANWIEDRRRVRRERRETGEAFREALQRFKREVSHAHQIEMRHQRETVSNPAELEMVATSVDSRLWERRHGHNDFMSLPVGSGCIEWRPQWVEQPGPEAGAVATLFSELHDVPVTTTLGPGDVAGVAGDRTVALGLMRQLVLQAAVYHGPADLSISIFTENAGDWDWAKWLPHVEVGGGRRLAASMGEIEQVVAMLPDPADSDTKQLRHLLVVDLPDLLTGPQALIREALKEGRKRGVAAIAMARRTLDLPSLATTIVSLTGGRSHVRFPDGGEAQIAPWAIGGRTARRIARALARVDDPEATHAGTNLPPIAHLGGLLGLGGLGQSSRREQEPSIRNGHPVDDAELVIAGRWRSGSGRPAAPIGVGADGPFAIDLVADGPHALLGGTTGSGKSELLRSLVASLAASAGPSDLNFVLVDYKGGSAFDACASLPHTVGLVTDLDDHLAGRALVCLEAELRYREERLRAAGVSDIREFIAGQDDPLPRLFVVIDEFAALATELPDFMNALVGIAQRGRSLGVHLLLATQRPNGVIDDKIKANTNLRMALRVQDVADSVDVIGSPDAAAIGRNQPGRALARLGPGDTVAFQTALVTGRSLAQQSAAVTAHPFLFAAEQTRHSQATGVDDCGPTDLEVIVGAAGRAAERLQLPPARLPWPDPLPEMITLAELPLAGSGEAVFALADEPHRQRQVATGWSPVAGNLLLYGLPGSGTTSAIASIAVATAAANDPSRLHMYVLDFDDQLLQPLRELPHVGAVVAGSDRERQLRLLRRLGAELQHRRQSMADGLTDPAAHPAIVTIIDNYGGFADNYGEPGDMAVHNLLARIIADGPGVGMMTVITAKHPGDVPTRIASTIAGRLVFRLADRYDYSGLGVPPVDPPKQPGRAFESGSGREVQVAVAHAEGLPAAVAAVYGPAAGNAPWRIDILPSEVSIAEFISRGRIASDEWYLPLGIGDSSLVPVGLILRDGEHALIAGPARSGKTTALTTAATVAKAADPDLYVAAITPRRSDLAGCTAVDRVIRSEDVDDLPDRSVLLLVDDAELVDAGDALGKVIAQRDCAIRIVAAGNADALRSRYGHWTQELRRSRIGCALRPNPLSDGDLWQTQLPRNDQQAFPAGRGYLVADGHVELVQLGRG